MTLRAREIDSLSDLPFPGEVSIDDHVAKEIQILCHAATPGPLVVDDETDGEGAVVATLPDGSHIVSLTVPVQMTHDTIAVEANAELICHARDLLLRLLHCRQQWKHQEEVLRERIRVLKDMLG